MNVHEVLASITGPHPATELYSCDIAMHVCYICKMGSSTSTILPVITHSQLPNTIILFMND